MVNVFDLAKVTKILDLASYIPIEIGMSYAKTILHSSIPTAILFGNAC